MANNNCQYSTRYCWDADKVKALIRLRAELSPLFTGKRNASKYAWAVVERELNVPLPLSKIIKKWNNLLQEYKAIKISEEPKRREWPFFTLMDVYFSDQVNDPSLRLFSSTKTLKESLDESVFEDDPIIASAIAAATSGACMDIDELLKRQKERRANDTKFTVTSKATDYSIGGNKLNVVTVKNSHLIHQQKENTNNMKLHSDHQTVIKNENVPCRPTFQQQQSPPPPTIQNKYADSNTIDQYLLSWNNFLGNMSRGFHTLQKDEKMVDVTIAAGGKIFKAHKLVLSVCSPYFQEIFLENPSNHPILLMADVEANHMAGLLNFMYSGQVNVKYEDLPVFLKVAEAMKIKGLHTEKPEGQNLKEIQFSRDDNISADGKDLNSSPISIPIEITGQTMPTSASKREDEECCTDLHANDHSKYSEPFRHSMKAVNLEQPKNKFSILKPNASKKMLDHTKQQTFLAKRKIFVQSACNLKEKRISDILENDAYNKPQSKIVYMPQAIPNDEVLNLTHDGLSTNSSTFLPINTTDLTNSCQYNQTTFTEIRKGIRLTANCMKQEELTCYVPKLCEDSNNNLTEAICGEKNNFPSRSETAFYNNDNKNSDNTNNCNINDNNNNKYNTENNSNTNNSLGKCFKIVRDDDNNNDYANESSESKTSILKNRADNNNNVFIISNSNSDLKENENDAEGIKVQVPLKTCSSLF